MKNVYNTMRVLSLFDGMSCGQIALKEIGITPEVYYASEIDKFAIKQTYHTESITWRFQNKKINPYRVLQVTDCTRLV